MASAMARIVSGGCIDDDEADAVGNALLHFRDELVARGACTTSRANSCFRNLPVVLLSVMASLAPAMPSSAAEYREATAAAAGPRGSRARSGCGFFALQQGAGFRQVPPRCCRSGRCGRRRLLAENAGEGTPATQKCSHSEKETDAANTIRTGRAEAPAQCLRAIRCPPKTASRQRRVNRYIVTPFPGRSHRTADCQVRPARALADLLQGVIGPEVHRSCKSGMDNARYKVHMYR